MTSTSNREIVAGPSTDELFEALRLCREERHVTFTLASSHITSRTLADERNFVPRELKFQAQVLAIKFPGLTGQMGRFWNFNLLDKRATLGSMYLEGCIDTTTGTGWVRTTASW